MDDLHSFRSGYIPRSIYHLQAVFFPKHKFFFEILEALAHHVRTRFEHPHRRHAQTWVDSQEVLDGSYQSSHTPTGKDRNGSDSHGIGFG